MKTLTRVTEPQPYDRVLHCGICGLEVHVVRADELGVPVQIDRRVDEHLREHHRFRRWLWGRLGWRWIVGGLAP